MSAQLADVGPRNRFTAHLVLAAGLDVTVHAPTLAELQQVVARIQPAEAANDSGKPAQGRAPAASPATTAAKADAHKPTAAASTPAAEPAAGPLRASTAAGDAGNATPAGQAAAAADASSTKPDAGPAVTFDVVKKAFLALSTKADGRAKCEGVLKPFGVAKLSEAKPEQYVAVLAEIEKASA